MLELRKISVQFLGEYLFSDANIKINDGDRFALVGSNGTGKSTLFKIIKGTLAPESGEVLAKKNIRIGHLPQDNISHSGKTLFEEVKSSLVDYVNLEEKEKNLTALLSNDTISPNERERLTNELGEIHSKQEELDYYRINSEIEKILTGLGFKEKDFARMTEEFSGGWQMRIALAKILIDRNDLLLLDEPTNHLDLESLEWLVSFLQAYKGAMIVISHDKRFINSIAERTIEIYLKKLNVYNGKLNDYLRFKENRDKQLEAAFEQQQKKLKETQRFIERFRYKASKAKQVQSRVKSLEKLELIELPQNEEEINIKFPDPPRIGSNPLDIINLSKSYGTKEVLRDVNLNFDRGDKFAFIGVNGAGKTTLSKIIAGKTEPTSGELKFGYNVHISYYAQEVADELDGELDILETVDQVGSEKTLGELRSLLGSFLFQGDDVFKKIKTLSGGEKSRVALSKILLTKSNFIILDEPTNHLDYASKLILQKALINFPGNLVIVSHDVDFIRPIANKILEVKDHRIKVYHGDIDYYLTKRLEEREGLNGQGLDYSSKDTLNKKDQKRIEAELRQKKYKATKDIVKSIEKIEVETAALEEQKSLIEKDLMDPAIYGNSEKIKETNAKYAEIKEKIDSALNKWAELSEELEKIEASFNSNLN